MRKTKRSRKKKRGGKSTTLKKLNCSPKSEITEIKDYSCYTKDSIMKLRDKWNTRHPDTKILSTNPEEIHKELRNYLINVCNTEACWLKQTIHFGDPDEEMKGSFAPKSPDEWKKNPNEWLSSLDISKVMKQYEKAYPCFMFIGPTPIDFDKVVSHGECVWDELCKLNIEKILRSGKNKIGIVFNTDTHDKSGEHWISMFIKIPKKWKTSTKQINANILFFDSVGSTAPKEVKILVNRIIAQGNRMKPKINFIYDENHPIEHQYGNTECGVYSLFFIVEMLKDKITGDYLKTHILKDNYIHTFRKKFYNSEI